MPYSHPQPIDRQHALRRIPHLLPGALAFAGMAGFINSVVLGFFQTPVSHMTGAVSHLGIDLADGRTTDALASASIVIGFTLGGIFGGFIIGGRNLLPGRRYGAALLFESVLLAASVSLLAMRHRLGLPLVSMACGLQNATTSSYCGLMIRSTHVTGTVTDIGVMIGHWLRHRRVEKWKLCFLCVVFVAFGGGGWIGALSNAQFGPTSLIIPAVGCLIAGGCVWLGNKHGWFNVATHDPGALPRTGSFPETNQPEAARSASDAAPSASALRHVHHQRVQQLRAGKSVERVKAE